uniref:Small ribosomal subunit protein bS18c n=1 Tax=Koliella corcontica TaxID=155904 RepID=A0A097KMW7_9CHLO|nr:ribosomal protein S18 [Koliella corcontica]AIT94523.1 ribosomal protein S18 [Koliella corcontica]
MKSSNQTLKIKYPTKKRIIPLIRKSNINSPILQETIDYKNIILLRKFITIEGKILPRRINGLNAKQQRYIAKAIKNARMVGLLPFINKTQKIFG